MINYLKAVSLTGLSFFAVLMALSYFMSKEEINRDNNNTLALANILIQASASTISEALINLPRSFINKYNTTAQIRINRSKLIDTIGYGIPSCFSRYIILFESLQFCNCNLYR